MSSVASPDESSAYDAVADDYEVARPGYPVGVFEAVEAYADFDAPPRVVEVGSGTGQATRQMAARGWTVAWHRARTTPGGNDACPRPQSERTVPRHTFRRRRSRRGFVRPRRSCDELALGRCPHCLSQGALAPQARRNNRLFWNAHVPHTTHPAWKPIRDVYLDVAPELADLAPLTPDRPDYDPETELRNSGPFDLSNDMSSPSK